MIQLLSISKAVQPLQNATIKSQTLREESTSVLCNWLLKLAQALMPVAYVRLRRRSLIGSGVCRRWCGFSLRGSESTEITESRARSDASQVTRGNAQGLHTNSCELLDQSEPWTSTSPLHTPVTSKSSAKRLRAYRPRFGTNWIF